MTAAVLTALTASLTFCAGLLVLTYAATGWFTSDVGNHYSDIATYLVRENADSALNVLVFGPILGVLLGLIGAQLGTLIPRGGSNRPASDP